MIAAQAAGGFLRGLLVRHAVFFADLVVRIEGLVYAADAAGMAERLCLDRVKDKDLRLQGFLEMKK